MIVERRYLQRLGSEQERFPPWNGLHVLGLFAEIRLGGGHSFLSCTAVRRVSGRCGETWCDFYASGETIWAGRVGDAEPNLINLHCALLAGELRGQFEIDAAHQLFWACVVLSPEGLRGLGRLHRESGEFYAIRGWEGRPCEACRHPAMTVDYAGPDAIDITRTCVKCRHVYTVKRADLLAVLDESEAA